MRTFKKPFSFNGRIDRIDFIIALVISLIMSVLIFYLIYFVCYELLYHVNGYYDGEINHWFHDDTMDMNIACIFATPFIWYLFASGAKRLHDVGLSGRMQILYPVAFFIMLFKKSDEIDNQYGARLYSEQPNNLLKSDSIEIPESCPNCKNPNTRKTRLCEWCGGQII